MDFAPSKHVLEGRSFALTPFNRRGIVSGSALEVLILLRDAALAPGLRLPHQRLNCPAQLG